MGRCGNPLTIDGHSVMGFGYPEDEFLSGLLTQFAGPQYLPPGAVDTFNLLDIWDNTIFNLC